MERVTGAGARPGQVEGTVFWLQPPGPTRPEVAERAGAGPDRAGEILRFRAALSRAVQDLQGWSESQPTLEARLLLQSYQEVLLAEAWHERACSLMDREGAPASTAALTAAAYLAGVMGRSPELSAQARRLQEAARWLAARLDGGYRVPVGVVVAAAELSAPELLDLDRPALIGGPDPVVQGTQPWVWGVPGLSSDWSGRRVSLDGALVHLDPPDPRWWAQADGTIGEVPVCLVDGEPETVRRMAAALQRRPVALLHRLDDLAAVPLFASHAAAVAIDLDRIGRSHSLRHPGFRLLVAAAARTGLPLLAGGRAAYSNPEAWYKLGFSGIYGPTPPQGGAHPHALRGDAQSGL